MRLMGAKRWQLHSKATLPSPRSWIIAGLHISVPYALVVGACNWTCRWNTSASPLNPHPLTNTGMEHIGAPVRSEDDVSSQHGS